MCDLPFPSLCPLPPVFVCASACRRMCARTTILIWRSEDNFMESVIASYHVSSRGCIQVLRLCDEQLYPLSYPSSPYLLLLR